MISQAFLDPTFPATFRGWYIQQLFHFISELVCRSLSLPFLVDYPTVHPHSHPWKLPFLYLPLSSTRVLESSRTSASN